MGVVSIGLAIASSYGLCSYFGLFYSPLMNVLPFLLLGIGVDDMFVLVNAYDNTNPYLSIAERLGNAVSTAGMSITVTSFTDIFAFLIGSTTSLPALRNFCFYAALGIFFDYLYQLTFFAAFLAIDERRRMLKKGDCFCCPTCDEGATCCVPCCKPAAGAPVVVVNGVQQEQVGPERMTKRVMGALADFLAKKTVKAAVLVLFSGIAAGGILGVSKIKVEADVMDFLPPGYLKDWVSTFDDEFSRGQGVELYTMTEFHYATDYDTTSVLKQAAAAFKANPYVQDESVVTWMDGFDTYLTMCETMTEDWKEKNCVDAPANTFNDKLYKFITTPSSPGGYAYGSDVKFDTTTNPPTIIATRVRATQVEGQDTAATIKAMDSIRSSIDSIPGNEKGYIFAYNEDFLNVEQYKSIDKEAIRNVSLTLLVCFIVIALLIVDPLTVSCVFINLLLIVINILGYMQAWGLNIDSVTVIMLVIALGLAVDYSAHIGRNFLEKHGLPNDRMRLTLRDMGVAVFHGAMSTMVAVLVLGSSDSYVFTTFFKQLFLCISLGLAHGLILLPVCLSLCNPNPYDDLEDDY
jgi:predicted RND superfamily exporter protein